jgi:ABC-type antimicrobial peptide transport system permease subunit
MVVRPSGSRAEAAAALRADLATLAPDVPLRWLGSLLDRQVGEGADDILLHQRLVMLAGAGALLLALLGLFAVAAEGVSRRTRELGIRMALGASAPALARTVLRESALTAGAGIVGGAALVAAFARVGNALLVPWASLGLGVGHPGLLAGAAGGVLLVCIAAAALGGRRGLTVDPAEALRVE